MDASIDMVLRIVPATETFFMVDTAATPANAIVQRDGSLIIQRDVQYIVDQRPFP